MREGMIGTVLRKKKYKNAHKERGIAIIRWGANPTHRMHKSFLQQQLSRLQSAILLALITMPDRAGGLKQQGVNHAGHQIGTHMIIKGQAQDLARPLAQSKATA